MLAITGAALTAFVVKLVRAMRERRSETAFESMELAPEATAEGSL